MKQLEILFDQTELQNVFSSPMQNQLKAFAKTFTTLKIMLLQMVIVEANFLGKK